MAGSCGKEMHLTWRQVKEEWGGCRVAVEWSGEGGRLEVGVHWRPI